MAVILAVAFLAAFLAGDFLAAFLAGNFLAIVFFTAAFFAGVAAAGVAAFLAGAAFLVAVAFLAGIVVRCAVIYHNRAHHCSEGLIPWISVCSSGVIILGFILTFLHHGHGMKNVRAWVRKKLA